MLARSSLALALTLSIPALAAAQGFEYAAGKTRYRVTQNTLAAQEIMGQKQEIESSSNQVVTVSVARPAPDTIAMDIVLDSLTTSNSMGMPTNMADRFIGMKVAARLSPAGVLYSSDGPTEEAVPNSASMKDAMARFLPRMRGRLARGATWTDTTSGTFKQGGIDIQRQTLSRFRVEGDTTIGADRGWKVVRLDSTTLSGSGSGQNGPVTLEGNTTGTNSIFVSDKGVFLGAEGKEEARLKIVLSANGMEVGVTQNATTRVERLK